MRKMKKDIAIISITTSNLYQQGIAIEEQADLYETQLIDLYENPRWYLDNFTFLKQYKVSFKCYSNGTKHKLKNGNKSKGTPTLPFLYVKNIKKNIPL